MTARVIQGRPKILIMLIPLEPTSDLMALRRLGSWNCRSFELPPLGVITDDESMPDLVARSSSEISSEGVPDLIMSLDSGSED